MPIALSSTEQVDVNEFIFDVVQASKNPQIVNFGLAYPDPDLYPRYHVITSYSIHYTKLYDCL